MVFKKQLLVGLGIGPALLVIFFVWRYSSALFAFVSTPADDPASRLSFAAHWLLIPGLTLVAGVVGAGRRGFYRGAIEGTRWPENRSLEINLRYNINTVEQTLLVLIAWPGLSLALPQEHLTLVPAAAFLFGFGRLTFWLGYQLHPLARAFGMVLTAVPTVIAYVWLAANTLG
ncbi:MAG TPA: hypothetical protein VGL35_07005 [Rhizomicrobium sp.]|jgi:hypothetical protein